MRKIVDIKKHHTDPAFEEVFARIDGPSTAVKDSLCIQGLRGAAGAFFLSSLFRETGRPLVVVVPTERKARMMEQDAAFFLGSDQTSLYPAWDVVSTDLLAFQRDVELIRIGILYRLLCGNPGVIVLPLKALMQKVMPRAVLEAYIQTIAIGDLLNRDALVEKLVMGGYRRETLVEEMGEFGVRGHVVDIFPPTATAPFRLEFFGDELESIRRYDPASQRSIDEIVDFVLAPAGEVIFSEAGNHQAIRNIRIRADELELPRLVRDRITEMIGQNLISSINPLFAPLFYHAFAETGNPGDSPLSSLFDFIPERALLVLDDPAAMAQSLEQIENAVDRFLLKARSEDRFFLEREASYSSGEQLRLGCERFQRIMLEGLPLDTGPFGTPSAAPAVTFHMHSDLGIRPTVPSGLEEAGKLAHLVENIRIWLTEGYDLTFVCGGAEEVRRTRHLLAQYQLPIQPAALPFFEEMKRRSHSGRLTIREGRISGSFVYPGMKLIVISDEDIFGKKTPRRKWRPAREGFFLKSFGELKEGNFVVHTEHGIGLYRGLQKLAVAGIENDFLLIEYLDGDRLYLPVDRLDRIQRYLGPDGRPPKVDKLGGLSWDAVKEKVKKSIRETAEELVAVYAAREVMERSAFSPPDRLYDEFSAAFEFEETPDQARAIEDIHLDMNDAKPMDRLICGDAGFGKTEVALRASFRAVMDGRQAAVLVPTTILAEQHYQTFSRRIKDYPIRVEALNRFKTKAEQLKILGDLRKGDVDIVIGTHRLLQKDVEFKDLGLVIIDEEQRFGVSHKEKLKKLRTLVDVLTLTATPIPRTLHLSLVGIRDLSIINTPPVDRQAIKTHVLEFNEEVIKEAIHDELRRDGQVFFLHDRVRSIYTMARLVEKLVPEAQVGVVHGQMKPKDIEDSMTRFVRGEVNVLVCTSIIGSGMDIPTANTIIINRADRFGLGQLYQIRGRVGRAKEEAAAYLIVPKGAMLSRDAARRLQAIMEFSEPGSGFRIASNDLDIRGGGNLLGTSQSGHVSAVGYELYTELMEKTIRELKGEPMPEDEIRPEINLGLSAFIPAGYMADEHQRLVTYKRLSMAASEQELLDIREELMDLYGFVPPEAEHLFEVVRIKHLLKAIRVKKMGYDGKNLFVFFHEKSPVDPARLVELSRKTFKGMRLTPDYKLYLPLPNLDGDAVIREARGLLLALSQS
ncbi:MAG: transcription-repair coupling factor [Pseudomonadota bacterium]